MLFNWIAHSFKLLTLALGSESDEKSAFLKSPKDKDIPLMFRKFTGFGEFLLVDFVVATFFAIDDTHHIKPTSQSETGETVTVTVGFVIVAVGVD